MAAARPIHAGLGALHGALAVIAGAFGAHGLEGTLSAKAFGWWETAAEYHLFHALALFAAGLYALGRDAAPSRGLTVALVAFQVGIALFSGSLYLMAVSDVRALGAVTPFGGTAFIVGWGALAWHFLAGRGRPSLGA